MYTFLDRRGFLKVMCGGTAALNGCAVKESGKIKPENSAPQKEGNSQPWQMRLSTSSIHFMQLPIEQACAEISKLGFEAIDIWSPHEGCTHLDDVAARLGPEGLKRLLAQYKLKLFSFSVYQGGYAKYADLLGKAGGGVAIQGAPAYKQGDLQKRMKEFLETLKPLIEKAEKYNSYLAIENHGHTLLNTLDSFKAFVDNNKSQRLGIALAPFHLQRLQASVPEAIRICGKQLLFFYAWQNQEGARQLPGIGPTDMTGWIRALAEIRYRGYVNPFMHGHPEVEVMRADLAKSRAYLLSCYKQICSSISDKDK